MNGYSEAFLNQTTSQGFQGRGCWPTAIAKMRVDIALSWIGGTWHTNPGTLIDAYESPLGHVPNVYLHANYIEALLDNRYKPSVPKWLMLMIDFVLSMVIYLLVHSVKQVRKRIGLLIAFLFPLLLCYVFFQNAGRYFDLVVPLTLCFIDLGRQTVKLRGL